MQLQGKTALITGGATGLGFETAKLLIEKGAKVHVCARTWSNLEQAQATINSPEFMVHQCDISDYAQVEQMVQTIGSIDILINAAGIWVDGELDQTTPEQIAQVIDSNFKGTVFVTRAVLPLMRQHNDGFIINVSSTSGTKPREKESVYASSKWAIWGFTDSLKLDLNNTTNIKVVGFYPGGMNTEFFARAGDPKENSQWIDPQKMAAILVSVLEQDDNLVIDHIVINKRANWRAS